jgi:hypothetical protein
LTVTWKTPGRGQHPLAQLSVASIHQEEVYTSSPVLISVVSIFLQFLRRAVRWFGGGFVRVGMIRFF